jgi:hypothetical protein
MVDADQEARSENQLTMQRAVLTLTFLLMCGGALAQTAPQTPPAADSSRQAEQPADDTKLDLQKPDDETPKADQSWWQKVLRESPECKSFTDGCRTCSRTVCSNIGIACQPKEWSCNDTKTDTNPDTKPEAKPDATPEPKP